MDMNICSLSNASDRSLLLKMKSKLWIVFAVFISYLVCLAITSEAYKFKLQDDMFEEILKSYL